MLHGEYRGSIQKGGPRAITFAATTAGIYTNATACSDTTRNTDVTGEDGGDPTALVHGWYQIEADIGCFWQQVRPEDACTVDPLATGKKLAAGGCTVFFVDAAKIDGIIAIYLCDVDEADLPDTCSGGTRTEGLVRVSRMDTILTMANTGEQANLRSPEPTNAGG